jgi:signal transduction histidine kinase
VSAVRPSQVDSAAEASLLLTDEVGDLAQRLSRHWAVEVTSAVSPATIRLGRAAVFEIGRMLREGVANAVRHGGARKVSITIAADGDDLALRIGDDGRGFPVLVLAQGDARSEGEVGPRSLRERARALGGEVDVESGASGALVRVRIPIRSLR